MAPPPSRPKTLLGSVLAEVNWARRRDIALAILGWLLLLWVALWAASHIIGALLTVLLAALLAYAIYPFVKQLSRWLPRPLAIAVAYVLVAGVLGFLIYLIVQTAILQIAGLVHALGRVLKDSENPSSPLMQSLQRVGISVDQVRGLTGQFASRIEAMATGAVPIIASVFGGALEFILVVVLSIYLQLDGHRIITWLRTSSPVSVRPRINFMLTTFERVVGGYIRGQITLAALIGVLVGVGMAVLQVPYAVLLGVLAFLLEFVPIIGVLVSGAACVLLALTKGPLIAVFVLAYFVFVHIIEGDVVGPRIVGRAVGLHPAVSIFALLAGAELWGLWGALLASPIAGVIQAVIIEVWREWRDTHPNQFPEHFGGTVVPVTTEEAAATTETSTTTTTTKTVWPTTAEDELADPGATTAISSGDHPRRST